MNDKAVRDASARLDVAHQRREDARRRLTSALDEDGKAAALLANANAELEQVVRDAARELALEDAHAKAATMPPFDPSTHFAPKAEPTVAPVALYVSESESDTPF